MDVQVIGLRTCRCHIRIIHRGGARASKKGEGGTIATSAFVAVHLVHFDLRQLIPIATVSFGLAGVYLWKRNLWINIIAHSLIDALALGAVAMRATNLY
jgi:membrane protease YdiL (CAAX protease family)